jgi:hypothetical protein
MPPPQAPPGNTGRQPPPSPQTGAAAPPTPQQGTKAAPKKKEPKEARKVCFKFSSTKLCLSLLTIRSDQTRRTPTPQQRQRQQPTPRLPRPRRRSNPRLLHPRHRLHPNTISHLTNQVQMPLRALHSSRHPLPPNRPWCNLHRLIRLSRHSVILPCLM